jgi:hypothetical protein
LLKAEASLAAVRAALGEIEQEMRFDIARRIPTSMARVNGFADRLAAIRHGERTERQ